MNVKKCQERHLINVQVAKPKAHINIVVCAFPLSLSAWNLDRKSLFEQYGLYCRRNPVR